ASRGIGRSVAKRFAAEGAKVAVLSRTDEAVQKVVDEIRAAGGEAIGIACDVTEPEQTSASVKRTVEAYGTEDILVTNSMDVTTTMGTALDTKIGRAHV